MFCEVIGQIVVYWAPIDMELTFFYSVFDPIKPHVHSTCVSLFNCVITVLCCSGVVSLSGVGGCGCGCPISSNVVRKIVASFAFRNTDPISASADDDIMCLRIVLMIKMAPLVSFLLLSILLPM
jgi:hypothetical protein